MKTFEELKTNPPKLTIVKDAREVIFTMISCMCNNKSYITFKQDPNKEFNVWATLPSGMGYSFSNYQFRYPKHEMLWTADEQKWNEVIEMLNSGTGLIAEVKSR